MPAATSLQAASTNDSRLPSLREMLDRGDRVVGIPFNVSRGPMEVELERNLFQHKRPYYPGFGFTVDNDVRIQVGIDIIDLGHYPEQLRLQGVVKQHRQLNLYQITLNPVTRQGIIEFLD